MALRLRRLLILLAIYAAALAATCVGVYRTYRIHPVDGVDLASIWKDGVLVRRTVQRRETPALSADAGQQRVAGQQFVAGQQRVAGQQLVVERITGESPLLRFARVVIGMSFVAARDGLRVAVDGKTIHLTPDDLLAAQIYDRGPRISALGIGLGLDVDALERLAAQRLSVPPAGLLQRADLRRIRVERLTRPATQPSPDADHLSRDTVRAAALAAAAFLARNQGADGRFRYIVDAPTDRTLPGYNWPRHAGATYFLAQAAAASRDPELTRASERAAHLLAGAALSWCGPYHCIGTNRIVDLGSSALGLLAFAELVRTGNAEPLRPLVADLARFIRSMQRPDGEFMHEYDRAAFRPHDVQFSYYTGEAALALSRAYNVTHDEADRGAAAAALEYLASHWSFFGSRYYFREEHWTCQAMADLWNDVPNRRVLDLCLRWAAFCRRLQLGPGDSPFAADGAISMGPFVTPRFTPAASRAEAAVATLDVARRTGADEQTIALLEKQVRRSLALVIRNQWLPGPTHLFVHPAAVYGAVPGSPADWQVRIDYAQHAGSAMLRWLEVTADLH